MVSRIEIEAGEVGRWRLDERVGVVEGRRRRTVLMETEVKDEGVTQLYLLRKNKRGEAVVVGRAG